MKGSFRRIVLCLFAVIVSLIIIPFASATLNFQIDSLPTTGAKPIIDGHVSAGEWPNYALHLAQGETSREKSPENSILGALDTYPIETYVYFYNDNTYLYVLVDAVGDATQAIYDECLLVFGLPPNYYVVEIWQEDIVKRLFTNGAAGDSNMGFGTSQSPDGSSSHRIYEFRIRLNSIGIQAGEQIAFYSPQTMKHGYYENKASMPYDSDDGRDNIFPSGLSLDYDFGDDGIVFTTVEGYSILQTSPAQSSQSIPTLNEWGLIILGLLLAGCTLWKMRQQNQLNS